MPPHSPPIPEELCLQQSQRQLVVRFTDGCTFSLPCEYLRVYSPSAAVRGHGLGQAILESQKANVNIVAIEPVGHYAVKLVFDDGHDSGLYTWDYLYELGEQHRVLWERYLARLAAAGKSRNPD